MPQIPRPLADLSANDIAQLVNDEWPEDDQLEFKRDLPAKEGGRADTWYVAQKEVGDRARNELIEEVIGFANAYGGDVVLGVGEVGELPARAGTLNPLPGCVDLAHRLELAARDCIDPPLVHFETRGVPSDEDGNGFVVLRTSTSRLAPHRSRQTLQCYQRRGTRTEKMTMRQIQDLTLQLARGVEKIEKTFESEADLFAREIARLPFMGQPRFAFRATIVPTNSDLRVEKVHGIAEVTPLRCSWVLEHGAQGTRFRLHYPTTGSNWQLGIRSTALSASSAERRQEHIRLGCDGVLTYWIVPSDQAQTERILAPEWLMAMVLNAVHSASNFRLHSRAFGAEFGLEIEVLNNGDPIAVPRFNGSPHDAAGYIVPTRVVFPTYVIGAGDEGLLGAFRAFYVDFWACIGLDVSGDEVRGVTSVR